MTKDELIAENAKLKAQLEDHKASDKQVRESLSLSLGSGYTMKQTYGFSGTEDGDPIVYNWYQIFREVGKLLAARNFMDFEGNVSELECKIEDLGRTVYEFTGTNS